MQELKYNKVEQGKVSQNSDYIKKAFSLLYKRVEVQHNIIEGKKVDELKEVKKLVKEVQNIVENLGKVKCDESGKELVLLSSGIVSSTRAINSERWKYLQVLPGETENSN